jgi:hypothetical protein
VTVLVGPPCSLEAWQADGNPLDSLALAACCA